MTCPGQGIIIDTGVPITLTGETPGIQAFTLESAGALTLTPESPFGETVTPERGALVLASGVIDPCTSLVADLSLVGYNGQFFYNDTINYSAQRI